MSNEERMKKLAGMIEQAREMVEAFRDVDESLTLCYRYLAHGMIEAFNVAFGLHYYAWKKRVVKINGRKVSELYDDEKEETEESK